MFVKSPYHCEDCAPGLQVLSSGPEVGRSLTQQELEDLSEEQKLQVLKIAEETVKVGSPKGDS